MGEIVQAGKVSPWRVACCVFRVLRSGAGNSRGEGRAGHDDRSIAAEKAATEILGDIDGSSIQSNCPLRFAAALDPVDVVLSALTEEKRDLLAQLCQPAIALHQFHADFLVLAEFDQFTDCFTQSL